MNSRLRIITAEELKNLYASGVDTGEGGNDKLYWHYGNHNKKYNYMQIRHKDLGDIGHFKYLVPKKEFKAWHKALAYVPAAVAGGAGALAHRHALKHNDQDTADVASTLYGLALGTAPLGPAVHYSMNKMNKNIKHVNEGIEKQRHSSSRRIVGGLITLAATYSDYSYDYSPKKKKSKVGKKILKYGAAAGAGALALHAVQNPEWTAKKIDQTKKKSQEYYHAVKNKVQDWHDRYKDKSTKLKNEKILNERFQEKPE